MLVNFLKTTWRFLLRNMSFTVINIIGLTVGIAAFLLISLYLQNELSFDKHLPEDVDVYRMVGIQEPPGIDVQHVAITSGGWAPWLNENVPVVREAIRLMHATHSLEIDGEIYREITFHSDGQAYKWFGLPIVSGSEVSLDAPQTAVISKEAAERIFGSKDVVGNTFRNNNIPYTILAVFDNDDVHSHIRFHVLLSISTIEAESFWLSMLGSNSVITYVAMEPGSNPAKVAQIANEHYQAESDQLSGGFMKNTFYFQPIEDIYLRSGSVDIQSVSYSGNLTTVYVFTLVAILVLVIACINFINLSTAGASKRAREVGMRKVLGANRSKLALQFIGESLVLTAIAISLSLVLLELFIPEFNTLLGSDLQIDFLRNPLFNVGLILLLVIVGLVSGFYPGWLMSRYQPIQVLKAGSLSGRPQAAWLRKVLVVFQFATSAALILATLVVLHQIRYMQAKDRGYDPDHVIYLSFDEGFGFDRLDDFRQRLLTIPEADGIALASQYNGVAGKQSYIHVADSLGTTLMARYGYVDPEFFPIMDIDIIKGRNFDHNAATDPYQAAIINESTWRALGWEDPIGQRVVNTYHEDYEYFTIVGVISDYNYYSVRTPIAPAIYLYQKDRLGTMNVRYHGDDHQRALASVTDAFHEHFPGLPIRAGFITDVLARQTRTEENTMKLFLWFSVLCVVISSLGLFGLTAYMTNQRRKEISIRKVLGGSVTRINLMLMDGFMRVVFIAVLIGLPVSYLLMNRWLDNYPYRIGIGAAHLGLVLIIVAGIAAITILFYSTRAARQNPVNNLKYE